MAVDKGLFLVSQDIAIRSGMVESRYRTEDGRFVLNERDMSRVRPTSEEILHGFDIEEITKSQALELARKNGYAMGLPKNEVVEEVEEQAEETLNDEYIEPTEEPSEEQAEEVAEEEEVESNEEKEES